MIELLVVITVIAILVSIALPVFSSVQEKARATQDMNNLRQLGIATQTYLNDNDGILFVPEPAASPWMKSLHPKYLPAWKIFQSPFDKRAPSEDETTAPVSYGINVNAAGIPTDKNRPPIRSSFSSHHRRTRAPRSSSRHRRCQRDRPEGWGIERSDRNGRNA